MGLGYVEGVTHDYFRHGTTTLFAALNVLDGSVIAQCKPRHRHQEFLSFLNHLDHNVPAQLEVHLIADNYATHKHPRVKAWLARHPRYHIHYTPTYSSWLNQVERWFGLITQQAIRRGSFRSVRQLVQKIDQYVAHHNLHNDPLRGLPLLIRSSINFNAFVNLLMGHYTSRFHLPQNLHLAVPARRGARARGQRRARRPAPGSLIDSTTFGRSGQLVSASQTIT
jgi:transposase